jgi:hypothetical protein
MEPYAFLFAFALQILAGSVLSPLRLIRYFRVWRERFGSERFAQLYPSATYEESARRFLGAYRVFSIVVVLIGAGVLAWLLADLRRPEWLGTAKNVAMIYFFVQVSPLLLMLVFAAVYHKAFWPPVSDVKRTATLQRRGLFDYVSPLAVGVAVASYFVFLVFAFAIDYFVWHNPTPSKNCLISVAAVTAVYLLNSLVIYKYLYGRKNPLVNAEGRAHTIETTVKGGVYGSISCAWFIMLVGTLHGVDLKAWEPAALSAFFAFTIALSFIGFKVPPRGEVTSDAALR